MKNINIKKILNNPKTKIILMVILLLIIVFPMWYGTRDKKGNEKENEKNYETFAHTEAEIISEETFEGLKFTNISLITDKGYTTFTADVINTNTTDNTIEKVYIDLKDKDGKTVISLKGRIGTGLKPNEKRTLSTKAKGEFKKVVSKSIREYKK